MRNLTMCLTMVALVACSSLSATAQIRTYYSYSPVIGPAPVPMLYGPPMVVARPVVVAPVPVVTAYRPIVPTYVAPAAVYSTYRPVYPVSPVVPVAPVPYYGTVARYRSGFVGPGLGGVPSVYTPGHRFAMHFDTSFRRCSIDAETTKHLDGTYGPILRLVGFSKVA